MITPIVLIKQAISLDPPLRLFTFSHINGFAVDKCKCTHFTLIVYLHPYTWCVLIYPMFVGQFKSLKMEYSAETGS